MPPGGGEAAGGRVRGRPGSLRAARRGGERPGDTDASPVPPAAGTRIIYDRKFLLERRNSPMAQTPPCQLPDIPGVTSPGAGDEPKAEPTSPSSQDGKPAAGKRAAPPGRPRAVGCPRASLGVSCRGRRAVRDGHLTRRPLLSFAIAPFIGPLLFFCLFFPSRFVWVFRRIAPLHPLLLTGLKEQCLETEVLPAGLPSWAFPGKFQQPRHWEGAGTSVQCKLSGPD